MTNAPKFKNFAESTIEEYFDVGDLSLVINSADTAKFPTSLSGGDYFFLTCFDGERAPEIVKVTAVSGVTFTVLLVDEPKMPCRTVRAPEVEVEFHKKLNVTPCTGSPGT